MRILQVQLKIFGIKPRIKLRNPKNLEEWRNVKKCSIERANLEFIERIKKFIEINGSQLDTFHINQIKKEIKKKYGEDIIEEENKAQ